MIMRKRFTIFTAILSIDDGQVATTLFEMLHLLERCMRKILEASVAGI